VNSVERRNQKPPHYGLAESVCEMLKTLYVDEGKSIRDSVRIARYRTGEQVDEHMAGKFIRHNGWTRSPSHYAKRSTFGKQNEACFAEAKARREGRI